jgi:replicative DNA helicase
MRIEQVIFSNIVANEDYARKTIPFLHSEYFTIPSDKTLYEIIDSYIKDYNAMPTKEVLHLELGNRSGLTEDQFKQARELIDALEFQGTGQDQQWLVDQTEKFCQDKALYNAVMQAIQIIDNKASNISKGSIPQILTDALAVSFDSSIGHDFLEDADSRYEFYHRKEVKVPFDIELLNKITNGGLPQKTLNIVLAGTGVGKSMFMCHCAANNLFNGLNVLYITMEMAEEKIAERIDANMMNVTMDELRDLPQDTYYKKIGRIREKAKGKLIIKEYPTASAGSANFRHLLNELRIKKNFRPDIIYIDYLNICNSSRIKNNAGVNSYTYIKAIAEELRGLAVEFGVPIISATQTTRSGYANSDVELTDTSESFGLPATADFMIALTSTEELEQLGQVLIKQLKNRYGDPSVFKRFVVGVDRARMKLYDCEQSAQEDLIDDTPVMDKTEVGRRYEEDYKPASKFDKAKFKGFN